MSALDKFGQFIIEHLRDKAIDQHLMMQKGHWKSPAIQELQKALVSLPQDQKDLILRVVVDVADTALHDFLFALQDAHDRKFGLEVLVDEENVAEESGMLNGEPLGAEGWIARFSKWPNMRK